ncbi:MAG: hypothetical protein K6B28_02090 [Lachnospiraceae bacterium]|nr:hypothetical protein [Lachnospiraceae bacterium]
MADGKKNLSNEELESVNGGGILGNRLGIDTWTMTVSSPSGYLTISPEPYWDQYHALGEVPNGYTVSTNGQITNGTGPNGNPCQYRKIQYNGILGWANAAYLS